MVPSAYTARSNWLDSQPFSPLKKYNDSHICVVGGMDKISDMQLL